MRHLKSGRKLNRTASHRKAMFANLATSLLDKERVRTTVAKAKEVRSVVERLITFGKKGTLHAIRIAAKTIKSKTILKKLFEDIAVGYKGRQGGYTRVVKLGARKGDKAEMAIIELVGRGDDVPRKRKKKRKTPAAKKPKAAGKPAIPKAEDVKEEAVEEQAAEEVKEEKKPVKKKEAKKKTEDKAKKVKEPKAEKAKKTKEKKAVKTKETAKAKPESKPEKKEKTEK